MNKENIIHRIKNYIGKPKKLIILIILIITIVIAFIYRDFLKEWQGLLGALITGIIAIAVVFIQKDIDRQRIKEEYRPILIVANTETNIPPNADYTCREDLYLRLLKRGESPSTIRFIRIRNISKNKAILMRVKIKYSESRSECSYFEVLDSNKEIFIMQSQNKIESQLIQIEELRKEALQKANFNTDEAIKKIQCQQRLEKNKGKEKPESIKKIDIYLTSEQNEKLHYVFLPLNEDWNDPGREKRNLFYFKLDNVNTEDYEFKKAPSAIYKWKET
ncbi:MAG TPA: hypothetical protein H9820_03800 [Candidatus Companilactobacillus pullicola]|uniref:Uncharacterized protein n=1 Tax=Candidatus Companilactobacillus pullicola TaxID=2838523 RepID=A0A9D2CLM5_9LACO|nr:hypothetical protein [Candidatus Companilactobacillus pullicola]